MPATTVTVRCDSREKKPLPLPAMLTWDSPRGPVPVVIRVERARMETADYVLADQHGVCYTGVKHAHTGVIETKRSFSEIAANVLEPRGRKNFIALLGRMRERYDHPLLVVEGGLDTLYDTDIVSGQYRTRPKPGVLVDVLQRLLMEGGVPYALIPGRTSKQRRQTADFVARFLLNGAITNDRTPLGA